MTTNINRSQLDNKAAEIQQLCHEMSARKETIIKFAVASTLLATTLAIGNIASPLIFSGHLSLYLGGLLAVGLTGALHSYKKLTVMRDELRDRRCEHAKETFILYAIEQIKRSANASQKVAAGLLLQLHTALDETLKVLIPSNTKDYQYLAVSCLNYVNGTREQLLGKPKKVIPYSLITDRLAQTAESCLLEVNNLAIISADQIANPISP